jgi:pilus assembly protein Flp/PilA
MGGDVFMRHLYPDQQSTTKKRRQTMNYLNKMYVRFQTRTRNEKGQTMVEYALILALIAVVCATVILNVGNNAKSTFNSVNTKLTPATTP